MVVSASPPVPTMEVWNKKTIPRPPDYTIEYTRQERLVDDFDVCVQGLLEGVVCGHAVLVDQEVASCMARELALLSTTLYQTARHRTEKFYRVLKKVEKCAQRWRELEVATVLDNLRHLLPVVPPPDRCVRLPSQQMFEYLLVRVLGGHQLLQQLVGYCFQAATFLVAKIKTGHFFPTATSFLAIVARLRALALDTSGQLSQLYEAVRPWLHRLKPSDGPHLAPHLPASLPPHTSDSPHPLNLLPRSECTSSSLGVQPEPRKRSSISERFLEELGLSDKLLPGPHTPTTAVEGDTRLHRGARDTGEAMCTEGSSSSTHNTGVQNNYEHVSMGKVKKVVRAIKEEDIGVAVTAEEVNNNTHTSKKPQKRKSSDKTQSNVNNVKKSKCVNEGHLGDASVVSEKKTFTVKKKNAENHDTQEHSLVVKKPKLSENAKKMQSVSSAEISVKVKGCSKKRSAMLRKQRGDNGSPVSASFVKHYQSVKKRMSQITTVSDLQTFLSEEKTSRVRETEEKAGKTEENGKRARYDQQRQRHLLSRNLSQEDFQALCKFLKVRLKRLRQRQQTHYYGLMEGNTDMHLLRSTKLTLKFWFMFPHLRGSKPANWTTVLQDIKQVRKK